MAEPTLDDVAKHLASLSDGAILQALETVALGFGLQAATRVKKGMNTRKLRPRTGRLRASVRSTVKRKKTALRVTLSAGNRKVPYIFAHEFGLTQKPKNAKYLRIPLRFAKTRAGVDRYSTPLRSSAPDLFYAAKSKKGNLLLWHREKKEPWYVLKKSVKIPKAPTVGPAFLWLEKNMIPALADAVDFELKGLK